MASSQRESDLQDLLNAHVKELAILKEKLPQHTVITEEEMDSVKVFPSMIDPEVVSPLVAIYQSRQYHFNNLIYTNIHKSNHIALKFNRYQRVTIT
jgi:hypothetical protein